MIKAWTDPHLDFIPFEVTGELSNIQSELPVLISEVLLYCQNQWGYTLDSAAKMVKAACEYGISMANLVELEFKE